MTSPLCLVASAQSYVDVEAERAQQRTSTTTDTGAAGSSGTTTAPSDPYASQPAKAYPATSYGLNSAPAAPASAAPTGGSTTASTGQGGQNLGNLFFQMQQLQQEVMRLNGKVEEQAHELRKLKDQSLQRYVDLDKRISGGSGTGTAAAGSVAPAGSAAPAASAAIAGSR